MRHEMQAAQSALERYEQAHAECTRCIGATPLFCMTCTTNREKQRAAQAYRHATRRSA